MTKRKTVRIDLPKDAALLDDGTRVAITGTIVHDIKEQDPGWPDPLADRTPYLEIETPRSVRFSDSHRGDDWWVVDAMVLVPADLWAKVCELFAFIENDPGWDSWKELER